jgi:hypothetical protein
MGLKETDGSLSNRFTYMAGESEKFVIFSNN